MPPTSRKNWLIASTVLTGVLGVVTALLGEGVSVLSSNFSPWIAVLISVLGIATIITAIRAIALEHEEKLWEAALANKQRAVDEASQRLALEAAARKGAEEALQSVLTLSPEEFAEFKKARIAHAAATRDGGRIESPFSVLSGLAVLISISLWLGLAWWPLPGETRQFWVVFIGFINAVLFLGGFRWARSDAFKFPPQNSRSGAGVR